VGRLHSSRNLRPGCLSLFLFGFQEVGVVAHITWPD
jgi:hypothetical protein